MISMESSSTPKFLREPNCECNAIPSFCRITNTHQCSKTAGISLQVLHQWQGMLPCGMTCKIPSATGTLENSGTLSLLFGDWSQWLWAVPKDEETVQCKQFHNVTKVIQIAELSVIDIKMNCSVNGSWQIPKSYGKLHGMAGDCIKGM